jgi:LCP family protein required for cell wall assembly
MNIVKTGEEHNINSNQEMNEVLNSEKEVWEVIPEEMETETTESNANIPEASDIETITIEEELHNNLEKNSIPIKYDEDVFNVLLIGSDTRKSGGTGRSDAMILVSINKETKKIIATSILRDIYLQIPGKKINNRINAAYAFGGADLLLKTVVQNFRVKVDKFASIDFYAFIDIVDAVGGVNLEVSEKEIPVINGYITELNRLTGQEETKDCLTEAGTLLLSGKQALGYARNRYVGNSDFERTARQRRVLEQIFEKLKSLDLTEIMDLLNIILPQVTTNLSEGEIFSLILSLPTYIDYDLEQWSIPKAGTYSSMRIRGMAVLGIDFNENILELHREVYDEHVE